MKSRIYFRLKTCGFSSEVVGVLEGMCGSVMVDENIQLNILLRAVQSTLRNLSRFQNFNDANKTDLITLQKHLFRRCQKGGAGKTTLNIATALESMLEKFEADDVDLKIELNQAIEIVVNILQERQLELKQRISPLIASGMYKLQAAVVSTSNNSPPT